MTKSIAGIDVHKRVLMVVVSNVEQLVSTDSKALQKRKFGTTASELRHLLAWLQDAGVQEVVMESTAQYWKPVWLALEETFQLSLAQAWSNRAPRGKKADFKDAERLVRRFVAGELTLSYIPDAAQREMRSLTRRRVQLIHDRVRLLSQVESLLEETRIKLSSKVSDLFGASALRIMHALADGHTDPAALAALADERIQCSPEELADALTGTVSEVQRKLLKQHLRVLELLNQQVQELEQLTATTMKPYSDVITRLARIPGIRVLAGQQILAEAGPTAEAFPSSAQFAAWIGLCPGSEESAGENHNSRCPKGNVYLRRVLCQAAQAAVRTKNSFLQQKFRRLLPRLGYAKAIWAIAHHLALIIWRILHEGDEYREMGSTTSPQAKKRREQRLKRELRACGYSDVLVPLPLAAPAQ